MSETGHNLGWLHLLEQILTEANVRTLDQLKARLAPVPRGELLTYLADRVRTHAAHEDQVVNISIGRAYQLLAALGESP